MFGLYPNITGEIKEMGLINLDKTPSGAFYKGELVTWNIEGKMLTLPLSLSMHPCLQAFTERQQPYNPNLYGLLPASSFDTCKL